LHLIGLGQDFLGHWLWDGSHWQAETPLRWPLAAPGAERAELLAAAINQAGNMVVVLASPAGTDEATDGLLFVTRTLSLPPPPAPTEVTPTPIIPPTNTPATASPEPSATPVVFDPSSNSGPAGPQSAAGGMMANAQLVVAFLPVVLLLLVVLGRMVVRTVRVKAR
jgi:hypothetical protein